MKSKRPKTCCPHCNCSVWKRQFTASTMGWAWVCLDCDQPYDAKNKGSLINRRAKPKNEKPAPRPEAATSVEAAKDEPPSFVLDSFIQHYQHQPLGRFDVN